MFTLKKSELLCLTLYSGFEYDDRWGHRAGEPNKAVICSLALARLRTDVKGDLAGNNAVGMAQKLLLFWRKPARRCWWEGVELDDVEGVDGKLKIWIRRVWTLEMVCRLLLDGDLPADSILLERYWPSLTRAQSKRARSFRSGKRQKYSYMHRLDINSRRRMIAKSWLVYWWQGYASVMLACGEGEQTYVDILWTKHCKKDKSTYC